MKTKKHRKNKDFTVQIEINAEHVIAYLRDCIDACWSTCQPDKIPIPTHQQEDFISAVAVCTAMNDVIEYLGGERVNLTGYDSI